MGASAVQQKEPLEYWRCPKCDRLLAKVRLAPGSVVQIQCKCKNVSEKA